MVLLIVFSSLRCTVDWIKRDSDREQGLGLELEKGSKPLLVYRRLAFAGLGFYFILFISLLLALGL